MFAEGASDRKLDGLDLRCLQGETCHPIDFHPSFMFSMILIHHLALGLLLTTTNLAAITTSPIQSSVPGVEVLQGEAAQAEAQQAVDTPVDLQCEYPASPPNHLERCSLAFSTRCSRSP